MAKIKGEFYSRKDAAEAMSKVNKHCISIKVMDYDYNSGDSILDGEYGGLPSYRDYDGLSSRYSFGALGFTGFPMTDSFGFGNMLSMGEYGNAYGAYDIPVPRAILEAEVAESNYSLVKERLYSCGAVSVY